MLCYVINFKIISSKFTNSFTIFSKKKYFSQNLNNSILRRKNVFENRGIKEFNEIIERNYDERINGDEKTFLLEATGK